MDEERRRAEEAEEEKRKAFLEGGRGRRGSAMELLAGVVSPTLEGIGLNKVGAARGSRFERCGRC